ncbi:MAG TPA: hypothetical protein VGD66_11245 [Allosphingosinicella sp.]|jgi:hypothetical protein
MRKAFALSLLLAAPACSGGNDSSQESGSPVRTRYEASPPPATSAADSAAAPATDTRASIGVPGIVPTAAPGVAFNYHYAFRLAGERIAAVQEQHATACEKLGLDRCRITGMRYRLVGNREVEAMLAFKLDPAIARAFGKQGIDTVTRAEGLLADSEITGEDAGARIAQANREEGSLADQLKKVEAQLARSGLSGSERAELQNQAQILRQQIQASQSEKHEQQESLATTPMVFEYGTGDLATGFDGRPRLGPVLARATDNFLGGAMWILVIAITLLPWALVAGLIWFGWRRLRPRFTRPRQETAAEA